MYRFAKFLAVGVINTAIDFLVLNLCIWIFGTGEHGELFVMFKGVSFLVAVTNSFVMNKYWVFERKGKMGVTEPAIFFIVSCIGFFINVTIASAAFVVFSRMFWPYLAANISALMGTIAVLTWNFIGYRFFVFNNKKPTDESE